MKVQWDFFSKRRNITLKEWVAHYKLKNVEEVNDKMNELGLEPPSPLLTEAILEEIAKETKPKQKPAAKKITKKPAAKKVQSAKKPAAPRKRRTTKK